MTISTRVREREWVYRIDHPTLGVFWLRLDSSAELMEDAPGIGVSIVTWEDDDD